MDTEEKNTSIAANITKQIDEEVMSIAGDWKIDKVLNVFSTILCIIMVVLVWYQILARNFNITVTWTDEVCRYIMITFTFIGAGLAIKSDEHIRINIIREKLSDVGSEILNVVENILTIGLVGFCISGSITMAKKSWSVPVGFTSKSLSIGHIYLIITIGLLIQELYLLRYVWYRNIKPFIGKNKTKEEK